MKLTKTRANKRYLKQVRRPSVVINPRKDPALIEALDRDKTPFSELCKRLLKEYYGVE